MLVNCDDYGRMDARPRILKAALYPLKELRDEQIADALRKLASAELVILYEVGGKPFLQTTTWARHQQIRAKRSRYPAIPGPVDDMQAPEIICKQMISDENSGYQEQSNDNRCTRNPIQSNPVVVRTRDDDGFIDPEEAHAIQTGHDDVFDAAKRAGFTDSDAVRDKLIALIAEYSAPWVLDGIARAVDRGKPNIGYLSGILKRYKAGEALTAALCPHKSQNSMPWRVAAAWRT